MIKLIHNENTHIVSIIEQDERESTTNIEEKTLSELKKTENAEKIKIKKLVAYFKKLRSWLEKNKIFFEVFSSICLGIIGTAVSINNSLISNKATNISEILLAIEENDRQPHFIIECEKVWDKVEETEGTDRIGKYKYTLTNNGGNITNVKIYAQSRILFYVPASEENEWYIFQYITRNFNVNYRQRIREVEKNNKFVFYEYTSEKNENEDIDNEMALREYLANNLNKNITCTDRNILYIMYTDYMGKERMKLYEFNSLGIWELEENPEGVVVGVALDSLKTDLRTGNIIKLPIDVNDLQAVGEALKEEIEDWLEKNKNANGSKNSAHTIY